MGKIKNTQNVLDNQKVGAGKYIVSDSIDITEVEYLSVTLRATTDTLTDTYPPTVAVHMLTSFDNIHFDNIDNSLVILTVPKLPFLLEPYQTTSDTITRNIRVTRFIKLAVFNRDPTQILTDVSVDITTA